MATVGGGDGRRLAPRIRSRKNAEPKNEAASTRSAPGPLNSCTSQPADPNAPTSATDALAASLLFPSTSSSRSTSAGRYASYAMSKKVVRTLTTRATA